MSDLSDIPAHPDLYAPWSQELAIWYARNHGEHSANRKVIEAACLKAEDRLLDLGCGSGAAVRAAASLLSRGHALGVDLSSPMVEIAQDMSADHPHRDRFDFVCGEASALPVPDRDRSVISAINSIHHWRNLDACLVEVKRVLVQGGQFIVCEDIPSEAERAKRHSFEQEEVVRILSKAGFQVFERLSFSEVDGQFFVIRARLT